MRKKSPQIIRSYCQKIQTSYAIVLEHTKALEMHGLWQLGNLYFDAVAMQLEVIAEYVCKILDNTGDFGEELPYRHPEVPWSQIHRFRQLLVHWYLEKVSPDDVKEILKDSLPLLIETIKKIERELSPPP